MRRSNQATDARSRAQGERGAFTPPPRVPAASEVPDSGSRSGGTGGSGSRLAVRNWRVPTRLNAILLIPVLVALVFGGFRVQSSISTWSEASDAEHTAELVRAADTYGNALIEERDISAEPLLSGHPHDPKVGQARDATDRAKAAFDKAAANMPKTARLERRLRIFRKAEPELAQLRQAAYTRKLGGVKTEEGYVAVQHPLMEFANELGFGTGNVSAYGRTLYSISLAKAAQSLERSIGTHLLVRPGPSAADKKQQLTAFASYAYLERIALEEFVGGGRPTDVAQLKKQSAKVKADAAKQLAAAKAKAAAAHQPFTAPPSQSKMVDAIGSGTPASLLKLKGITPETWFATASGKFDAYRAVERHLTDEAVQETQQISDDARTEAIVNSLIVLAALIVAFVIARLMASQMSRSMLKLRSAAFDVAEQRLPAIVEQLSRTDPGRIETRVTPIPIDTRDEIGAVARAFDQVHREAVRLAAEQALLRGNVNAIFTNLSARNQGLIERQLALISDLENNEADPDQLESLFHLDHLATRMRRNGENLLVLAGGEPDRDWGRPVPLVDILRAAASEVEDYARIDLSGVPETDIHGQVVNDLVHLLAELLENATAFSAEQTRVDVTATRLPDGRVMIEIHDKGIGLTAEDFADINHKLAKPPTVDAAVSRRMGLYVVGRLAARHGIRVQLRPSGEQVGTTSLVMLPEPITHGGGAEEPAEEEFTVSRIMPEQPAAHEPQQGQPYGLGAPPAPAGELGYGGQGQQHPQGTGQQAQGQGPRLPEDLSAGDPVDRNRQRDERRAALQRDLQQAQQGGQGGQQQGQGGSFPGFGQSPQPQQPQQPQGFGGGQPGGLQGEFGAQPHGGAGQDAFQEASPQAPYGSQVPSYGEQFAGYGTEAESAPAVPEDSRDRVGFDQPGPSPSNVRSTTGAGLPRREPVRPALDEDPVAQPPRQQPQPESPEEWPTANDERWNRAGRLRAPQADGVTDSGLPRRVPRANLVEGAAEQLSQGGPMVSRSPEDVRGRLANLHRGVRRGRTAGDGTQNDRQGFGPGSTYDQER